MMPMEGDFAIVKTELGSGQVLVPISASKPGVPQEILQKWQRIIDSTARILKMPSGLITRLSRERLHIVVASRTEGNPYKGNDSDSLGIGMFCESVAGMRNQLVVQDTNDSDYWRTNPHAGLGMRSYCGLPIFWNDGEIFGTFCMLSDQTNQFSDLYQQLLAEFREVIELDLRYILTVNELEKKLNEKELYMREVHHRVKNHFNLLISLINLQAQEDSKDINAILADLQNRLQAIALVHEKLHSGSGSKPDLHDYISELANIIVHSFSRQQVGIQYDIAPLELPLESSVPIGLIITELLSNSLKYAQPENQARLIEIQMKGQPEGNLEINYRDNGPGYPPDIKKHTSESLGMSLIQTLTEQLGGETRLYNDNGACYSSLIRLSKK